MCKNRKICRHSQKQEIYKMIKTYKPCKITKHSFLCNEWFTELKIIETKTLWTQTLKKHRDKQIQEVEKNRNSK